MDLLFNSEMAFQTGSLILLMFFYNTIFFLLKSAIQPKLVTNSFPPFKFIVGLGPYVGLARNRSVYLA